MVSDSNGEREVMEEKKRVKEGEEEEGGRRVSVLLLRSISRY